MHAVQRLFGLEVEMQTARNDRGNFAQKCKPGELVHFNLVYRHGTSSSS